MSHSAKHIGKRQILTPRGAKTSEPILMKLGMVDYVRGGHKISKVGHVISQESKKKKEKKLRDVTSQIFAQTTHIALPPPKLSCGVGSRRESSSKSVQGFWLPEGSKSVVFLCLALWLI